MVFIFIVNQNKMMLVDLIWFIMWIILILIWIWIWIWIRFQIFRRECQAQFDLDLDRDLDLVLGEALVLAWGWSLWGEEKAAARLWGVTKSARDLASKKWTIFCKCVLSSWVSEMIPTMLFIISTMRLCVSWFALVLCFKLSSSVMISSVRSSKELFRSFASGDLVFAFGGGGKGPLNSSISFGVGGTDSSSPKLPSPLDPDMATQLRMGIEFAYQLWSKLAVKLFYLYYLKVCISQEPL